MEGTPITSMSDTQHFPYGQSLMGTPGCSVKCFSLDGPPSNHLGRNEILLYDSFDVAVMLPVCCQVFGANIDIELVIGVNTTVKARLAHSVSPSMATAPVPQYRKRLHCGSQCIRVAWRWPGQSPMRPIAACISSMRQLVPKLSCTQRKSDGW